MSDIVERLMSKVDRLNVVWGGDSQRPFFIEEEAANEIRHLRAINAELVEALEHFEMSASTRRDWDELEVAHAALAKAKEPRA